MQPSPPCFSSVAPFSTPKSQGGTDANMSKMSNYQNECAIIKNPSDKLQLFAACNNATGGLFAARSADGGLAWTYPDADKTIADGDAQPGAARVLRSIAGVGHVRKPFSSRISVTRIPSRRFSALTVARPSPT